MDFALFAKAVGVGIAVATPVGPMSLLCIQLALERGQGAGLAFGAGVAAADGSYAALAAFSVMALTAVLLSTSGWIQLAGSILLIFLGARIALGKPNTQAPSAAVGSGAQAFATAYALTLANPPTIVFFAGVYASVARLASAAEAATFSLGVIGGSMIWWLLLTTLVRAAAKHLTPRVMRWINLCSGLGLAALGFFGLIAGAGAIV